MLLPGVEPGNHRSFVSLLGHEHDVVRAVAVETALAVEVALAFSGCRELCNSLAESREVLATAENLLRYLAATVVLPDPPLWAAITIGSMASRV